MEAAETIIGKVFEGRVIDRVVEISDDIFEIGFTDHSFERIHANDIEGFANILEALDSNEDVTKDTNEDVTEGTDQDVTEDTNEEVTE